MSNLAAVVVMIDHLLGNLITGIGFVGPDQSVTTERAFFEGYLGKERAELVVLVLGPSLKWMIVTLIAVEANSEEGLRNILGHFAWVAERSEVVAGGIFDRAALRQRQVSNKGIVWSIRRKLSPNPIPKYPNSLFSQVFRIALQEVRKLVRPKIGISGSADQFIDQ